MIIKPELVRGAGKEKLKAGLVGCGGRGTQAVVDMMRGTELGGRQKVAGGDLREGAELLFSFEWEIHAEEEVAEFAAQFGAGGVEDQGAAEIVDERVMVGEEFAGESLVLVCAASDEDLIAFFAGDFYAQETDVSDVVLGAGVVTAGDVEVDGLVKDREALV